MSEAKVKISIGDNEVEIQGDEGFVERQIRNVESLLKVLNVANIGHQRNPTQLRESASEHNGNDIKDNDQEKKLPDTFGEWFSSFPNKLSDTDKALIAAYYIQRKSDNEGFRTSDVNNLLKEQNINLSNPSDSIRKLSKRKLVFIQKKAGKKLKIYKVSREGEKYIYNMMQ